MGLKDGEHGGVLEIITYLVHEIMIIPKYAATAGMKEDNKSLLL